MRLVIYYFGPLGFGMVDFLAVFFIMFGSEGGGNLAVEGGEVGLSSFSSFSLPHDFEMMASSCGTSALSFAVCS